MDLSVTGIPADRVHFVGVFGSGMSALAQYLRFTGAEVSGSDRLFEHEDVAALRDRLKALEVSILPQDGSGVTGRTRFVCASTAIEGDNADLAAARRLGVPVVHRSDLLAAIVASRRTVAVAGTSGKSTVTALLFEILTRAGLSPGLLSGANLIRLEERGLIGNAFLGASDLLVVEADESDGSLVRYPPDTCVILNVSKDHKPVAETVGLFREFAARSRRAFVNADDPRLAEVPGARFGTSEGAGFRPDAVECLPRAVAVRRGGREFRLPLPGRHNVENLLAALCAAEALGADPGRVTAAVAEYRGVARRFAVTPTAAGVTVVDDFAHNPAKVTAAIAAARGLSARVFAVYQPHGFTPLRFFGAELAEAFREALRPGDGLLLLPVYYAGGTTARDVSSADVAARVGEAGFPVHVATDRDDAVGWLRQQARPGDVVLLMGARDPSLPALARRIAAGFGGPAGI